MHSHTVNPRVQCAWTKILIGMAQEVKKMYPKFKIFLPKNFVLGTDLQWGAL